MASYRNFTIETDSDGIALVTWDMPDKSMNVFTEEVMKELEAKAAEMAALEKKQEEERRKKLFEMEKQAAAAGQPSPEELADKAAAEEAEKRKAEEDAAKKAEEAAAEKD